jgi:hypothetical protein
MEFLEQINKLEKNNYFDQEDWEEDKPSETIPLTEHKKYENLEIQFNQICEETKLESALQTSTEFRNKNKINSNNFIYGEIVSFL